MEYDDFREEKLKKGEPPQVYWGPGQWHSAYTLKRLADRNKDAKGDIEAIRKALHLENFTNIQWLGLAARWAGLLTRKSGD